MVSKLQKHFRRDGGFTLIELMIVVAIIGILAAIAIPNFTRFQLKSKSSEGKVNLAAIRTAEEAYTAEFGGYVAGAVQPAAASVGTTKVAFSAAGAGWQALGWAPTGPVYFSYQVAINGGSSSNAYFIAGAQADIDGNSTNQIWGYMSDSLASGTASACTQVGLAGVTPATAPEQVGICLTGSGASVF